MLCRSLTTNHGLLVRDYMAIPAIWKRNAHSAKRKELIPLIKRLHPDLMAHHSEAVKKLNMNCVQNLNDLWDTLETNVQATIGKNVMFGLDIKVAFRTSYDLTCFLKKSEDGESVENAKRVKQYPMIVHIPEALCKRQSISHKVFMSSIDLILQQQGMLFEAAGLGNPWKKAVVLREVNEMPTVDGQRPVEELSSELETKLFERWLIKNSRLSGITSRFDRKKRSNYSRVFSSQHSRNAATLESGLFGNRRAQEAMFADEVDFYLKAGNVVVAPMAVHEEFAAVKQLRQFFIDYGDVLNFGTGRWHTVYVMLHGYSGAQKFQSKARQAKLQLKLKREEAALGAEVVAKRVKKAAEVRVGGGSSRQQREPEEDGGGEEAAAAAAAEEDSSWADSEGATAAPPSPDYQYYPGSLNNGTDNGGYAVEKHGEHFLVRVPATFKISELLEFMGKVLPAARIDLR